MRPEALDAAGFQAATGASRGQMERTERYRAMLTERNAHLNLVGPATLAAFWRRHAYDSWQLLPAAPAALRWADLGSGAGLPGIILAIFLKDRERAHVHLIDSLLKRCRFLEAVVAALDLPATVHHARAEATAWPVDVVTARACAPLDRLLGYARPWLDAGAAGLFLQGEAVEAEIVEARANWRFDVDLIPSVSDPRGRLVRIERLARRAGQ